MEQVNVREFRQRMSFYLNNLPVQLTRGGEIIATISKGDDVYTPSAEPAADVYTKEQKIAELREKVRAIEDKVPPAPEEEELRVYTEYDPDTGEITWTGTYRELVKQKGKKVAAIAWAKAKPVAPEG